MYTPSEGRTVTSSADVIAILKKAGWTKARQKGSHVRMTSADGKRHTTVPHPYKDLKQGTLKAIEKDTGVSLK
jgi:predicted RNA binding protein YcfA (HicA-like mRNA interferase family)